MKTAAKSLVNLLALLIVVPTLAQAQQPSAWPQFRGPGGTGVAENQHPPVEFGPDKNVAWKVAVPSGASSPIIVGDLLVLTAFENNKLLTIAYHRADGSEAWRAEAPYEKLEGFHAVEGSPAASTAATDGERIVTYFGSCGLFCYNLTGKELWRLEMPTVTTIGDFGTGVSPIIADGRVILVRDETTSPKIVVVSLESGEVLWEKTRSSTVGFGTPVVWHTPDGVQIAAPGFGRMIGYDLTSGEEVWYVDGMPAAGCTTPMVVGDLLYYAGWSPGGTDDPDGFRMPTYDDLITQFDANKNGIFDRAESEVSPFKGFFDNNDPNKDGQITREEYETFLKFVSQSKPSAFALRPGGKGDCSTSHVNWKQKVGLPYVASAIVYDGQMVMIRDGGIVTSYDQETGKQGVRGRINATGTYYASPVAAGGHIYFTSLADGTTTVVKLNGNKLETAAENSPLGERTSATPAIADDTLYVRTAGHLYAFRAKE